MNTEYRIRTNGEYFKIEVRTVKEIRRIVEKKTIEDRSVVWEEVGVFGGLGLAFVYETGGIYLKKIFDSEKDAEAAAEKAWGQNRLRHREWRTA